MFFLSATWLEAAGLNFASLFTDHMVLQRDQSIPVWGTATPGDVVTVEFAGQTKSTQTGLDGRWEVKLDPLPASSDGRELVAHAVEEGQKINLSNVVVGDVWLGSGQSNMHFPMKRVYNFEKEMVAARHPAIRFFYVNPQFARTPMDTVEGEWKPVLPETVEECSAVAFYFARDLQETLNVPIGLILSSVGGTRIETWMDSESLSDLGLAGSLLDKWKSVSPAELAELETEYKEYQYQRDHVHRDAVAAAKRQGLPVPPEPKRPAMRPHDCPGALHEGMIAPLQPFALRGALWYQGEANMGGQVAYEKMLPALIADWRDVWGDQMPFLIVQLPPHESITPAFREAQFRIWQKTPLTALVVTTDVGDAKDIHPIWKKPVGQRLAVAARAVGYGEQVEYSGPVFQGMRLEGDRAVISFTHVGDGLMAKGEQLKGFMVAGRDQKFFPANAEIEGSTVVVSAPEVEKPEFVHYGNEKVPKVNLFNKDGLPAVPFRSDQPMVKMNL